MGCSRRRSASAVPLSVHRRRRRGSLVSTALAFGLTRMTRAVIVRGESVKRSAVVAGALAATRLNLWSTGAALVGLQATVGCLVLDAAHGHAKPLCDRAERRSEGGSPRSARRLCRAGVCECPGLALRFDRLRDLADPPARQGPPVEGPAAEEEARRGRLRVLSPSCWRRALLRRRQRRPLKRRRTSKRAPTDFLFILLSLSRLRARLAAFSCPLRLPLTKRRRKERESLFL